MTGAQVDEKAAVAPVDPGLPLVAHLPSDAFAGLFGTISPGDLALCGAPLLGIEPFGNWSKCEACVALAGSA